ncbi:hypothetical protein L1987_11757 [Smallanthus sonchifolius]|uniref:Uncharacterized protein n=1 Tax=Smallanthus sonchifolius TaxID=185202 RepID=A0ACB9JEH6_9ASTR|nr:hypothetical protein L1987_11757 [Smallanthus sonchifolius]
MQPIFLTTLLSSAPEESLIRITDLLKILASESQSEERDRELGTKVEEISSTKSVFDGHKKSELICEDR